MYNQTYAEACWGEPGLCPIQAFKYDIYNVAKRDLFASGYTQFLAY